MGWNVLGLQQHPELWLHRHLELLVGWDILGVQLKGTGAGSASFHKATTMESCQWFLVIYFAVALGLSLTMEPWL